MDMKEGQDPEVFITKLEYNRYRMEELGSKISDKQLKIRILNNLPMEYDVSVDLLTRRIITITLEEFRADLQYEYIGLKSRKNGNGNSNNNKIIIVQMKNMPYLRAENSKESVIIVVNLAIKLELVGSKIQARNQMVVAVVEVVSSKILLLDEGAIIKEVAVDKEDEVAEDSAEPVIIVRKLINKFKTATKRKEMKVERGQQWLQVNKIITVMGIITPTIIITAIKILRWLR
jgi:gag-polypeptide of LTR copia-type